MAKIERNVIVYGNDFDLYVDLKRFDNSESDFIAFDLSQCTDVRVFLICSKHGELKDMKYEIVEESTIKVPIDHRLLHTHTSYGIVVEGYDENEAHWRFELLPSEGFLVVPNTSGLKTDDSVSTVMVSGTVGWGIEKFVNADWEESDPTAESYIENKPDIDGMINTALEDYYDKTETDTLLAEKADNEDIPTEISELHNDVGYITQDEVIPNPSFPSSWPTTGSISSLITAINNDTNATPGKSFMDTVNYSDLPTGLVQAELKVDVISEIDNLGKVIDFTITSDSVSPYHWEATSSYGASITWRTWGTTQELNTKQDTLVSGTNIKTVDGQSILGSGNLVTDGFKKVYSTQEGHESDFGLVNVLTEHYDTEIGYKAIIEGEGLEYEKISAKGHHAHAEGIRSHADGMYSHAESTSSATGMYSHSEGALAIAYGYASHAEGFETRADGDGAHSEGYATFTGNDGEHASGRYNNSNTIENSTFGDAGNTLFSVGNGYRYPDSNNKVRHNAFEIRQNGDILIPDVNNVTYPNYYEKPMLNLQDELDSKQPTLVSGTNIKTVNNQSLLGSGNVSITTPVQANWAEADTSALAFILNKPDLSIYAQSANLATVATTGSYTDLTDKPTIPAAQVNADWNSNSGVSEILNKPNLATVATSGSYTDLTNTPTIPAAQVNADWNSSSGVSEILNKPNLATVATSGSYTDLTNTPTIPAAPVQSNWNETDNTSLAYIQNKPTIPAAQVNADWNSNSGVSEILNKPSLATVATSGSYTDLTNTPTIPAAPVQSNWNETDTSSLAYIQNKPDLSTKQDLLVSGTNIKTINNQSILGSGNLVISGGDKPYEEQYLTFEAIQSGTFTFLENALQYSLDDGATWTTLTAGTATPTLSIGDKILWKQTGLTPTSWAGIGTFSATGNFNIYGNIMSLLYGDNFIGQKSLSGKEKAFYKLFYQNTKLVSAENLVLFATILGNNCYYQMFNGCTSLTTAPELPATTLAANCYTNMFNGCSSLTTAPELPATTLANYCYSNMFNGCTSLNYIKCLATNISASNCTSNWVSGVAASGTFITANNAPAWTRDANGIPSGWNAYTESQYELVHKYELNAKQDTLVSGTNIKTINSQSILGSGDITISGGGVQSNWNETDTSSLAYIQNKPTIPAAPVQSNWNETDNTSLAYIQNKPTIPSSSDFVTLSTNQDITGKKNFKGQKLINFYQTSTSTKLGFTLYDSQASAKEVSAFEYRPNTLTLSDNIQRPLLYFGHYNNNPETTVPSTVIGFRNYLSDTASSGAYHLLVPLVKFARQTFSDVQGTSAYPNYWLPLGFTFDGANYVKAGQDGSVNFSNTAAVTSSTNGLKIEVVSALPASPDSNTIYIIA